MEHDHIFKIDAIDVPPVPYCDESSDGEMEAQSKGPNGKMPDLLMPPTDPEEKYWPATSPSNPSLITEPDE